ncbi:MAG: hypothetical protein GSR85_10045 [Desulfurococcales archaeon]|nr:hypothetical protein [Desulfurococcales archaeon]
MAEDPERGDPGLKQMSFEIEEELAESLYACAMANNIHVSEVIRRTIRYYIENEPKAKLVKPRRIKIY